MVDTMDDSSLGACCVLYIDIPPAKLSWGDKEGSSFSLKSRHL